MVEYWSTENVLLNHSDSEPPKRTLIWTHFCMEMCCLFYISVPMPTHHPVRQTNNKQRNQLTPITQCCKQIMNNANVVIPRNDPTKKQYSTKRLLLASKSTVDPKLATVACWAPSQPLIQNFLPCRKILLSVGQCHDCDRCFFFLGHRIANNLNRIDLDQTFLTPACPTWQPTLAMADTPIQWQHSH
jgi:hypothetical protein